MMLHTKYQCSMPCGSGQEDLFHVFPIKAYVKHLTPGWGGFWPQGYNLNKLGRGILSVIKALGLLVSDKKIF